MITYSTLFILKQLIMKIMGRKRDVREPDQPPPSWYGASLAETANVRNDVQSYTRARTDTPPTFVAVGREAATREQGSGVAVAERPPAVAPPSELRTDAWPLLGGSTWPN